MGARLHLVGPLGFRTDERACRRAGLDYWKHVDWVQHDDLVALQHALPARRTTGRRHAVPSIHGGRKARLPGLCGEARGQRPDDLAPAGAWNCSANRPGGT